MKNRNFFIKILDLLNITFDWSYIDQIGPNDDVGQILVHRFRKQNNFWTPLWACTTKRMYAPATGEKFSQWGWTCPLWDRGSAHAICSHVARYNLRVVIRMFNWYSVTFNFQSERKKSEYDFKYTRCITPKR